MQATTRRGFLGWLAKGLAALHFLPMLQEEPETNSRAANWWREPDFEELGVDGILRRSMRGGSLIGPGQDFCREMPPPVAAGWLREFTSVTVDANGTSSVWNATDRRIT